MTTLLRYGITDSNGFPVLEFDGVMEVDVTADSDVNSHPVEQGGFSAYNKVQEPISIRLLLSCQGKTVGTLASSQNIRSAFLSTLADLREGTKIVTISTPDASYRNMVLKRYGYKKTAERGAVTIWADTEWVEERSTNVVVSHPPTVKPQGTAKNNLGTLQATTPSAKNAAAINNPVITPSSLPSTYSNTAPPSGKAY